jgi:hypothetical protein
MIIDSKQAMREYNQAWGYYYHQVGFARVLEAWCDDLKVV